jgi:tudor domain-containing protein 3
VESVPVQNQAAAQKLLQKLNQPYQHGRHPRGRGRRGKGQEEDEFVFTLEEYEKRKAQVKPSNNDEVLDISRDEDLAWQLQNQFNLEHSQVCSLISFRDVSELNCFRFSSCSLFYLCNTCFNILCLD